ncbi:MAG: methyltransferase domain-containing protein [Pirellulaceae bacterium]
MRRKLNIGCGRRFHTDWVNLDLDACHPSVLPVNVLKGLPFEDGSFEAVYHSHLLEHLTPEQGHRLIEDCFRVLEPNGVLRIVIPDLERIARLYLQLHDNAWHGDESAAEKYNWIKLELLDQMVRHQSGGMMGRYMASLDETQESFVRSRIGAELDLCRESRQQSQPERREFVSEGKLSSWRNRLSRWVLKLLMGKEALRSYDETMFRMQGEIHRWMYDRFSLRELCETVGFTEFRVCAAEESDIDDFNEHRLDTDGRRVYKPDSLFVECRKPNILRMPMSYKRAA